MIRLEPHAEGVLLPVHAQPGARRAALCGEHAGCLKVAVTKAPEKGRANQALVEVLCEKLGLSRSQVVLLAGPCGRRKQFLIRGLDTAELARRIAAAG